MEDKICKVFESIKDTEENYKFKRYAALEQIYNEIKEPREFHQQEQTVTNESLLDEFCNTRIVISTGDNLTFTMCKLAISNWLYCKNKRYNIPDMEIFNYMNNRYGQIIKKYECWENIRVKTRVELLL